MSDIRAEQFRTINATQIQETVLLQKQDLVILFALDHNRLPSQR